MHHLTDQRLIGQLCNQFNVSPRYKKDGDIAVLEKSTWHSGGKGPGACVMLKVSRGNTSLTNLPNALESSFITIIFIFSRRKEIDGWSFNNPLICGFLFMLSNGPGLGEMTKF